MINSSYNQTPLGKASDSKPYHLFNVLLFNVAEMLLYALQGRLKYLGRAAYNMAGFKVVLATVKVTDQTARLFDQQSARRKIPFLQIHFPERIKATGSYIR